MSFLSSKPAMLASFAAFAFLAGCAQHSAPPPVVAAVPYNPPGTALAALPKADITWYHVDFPTGSAHIDAAGRQAITTVAESMNGNTALTATVIGKTDTVGNDAANMRLSEQRARAVRNALVQVGHVAPQRIETRWTGDRHPATAIPVDATDTGSRAVDIAIH